MKDVDGVNKQPSTVDVSSIAYFWLADVQFCKIRIFDGVTGYIIWKLEHKYTENRIFASNNQTSVRFEIAYLIIR